MKKQLLLIILTLTLLLSGCNFKVQTDQFKIPSDKVVSIEILREFTDENGNLCYRKKIVSDAEIREDICKKIRSLPVERFRSEIRRRSQSFQSLLSCAGRRIII